MDKSPQFISPQTDRESTSPMSPKRLKTDCTMTSNQSGINSFELLKILTFPKTTGDHWSSPNTFQKNTGVICTPEYDCGDMQHVKQLQATTLNVTCVTEVTNSHTGPPEVCFVKAERHFVHLGKDEQLPVIESDKLSSYRVDDAGGILAEYHTSIYISADSSRHCDCKQVGKSLHSCPSGNDADGRQAQNIVSQIQAVMLAASDGEVSCHSDCTHEDVLCDHNFSNTRGQPADVEEANQKRDERGFGENILCNNENKKGYNHMSPSDYEDSKSFCSFSKVSLYGNSEEEGKNGEQTSGFQSGEKENNKRGVGNNSHCIAAKCAEGSSVSSDVVLDRIITAVGTNTSVSHETDDFCGAKGEDSAGTMIAKAQSETTGRTAGIPLAARISQEPAEGDNEAGPFSVIDPAMLSKTDREPEEKLCNSESAAGVELSPSQKASVVETSGPLCSNVRPSQYSTKELSPSDQIGKLNNQRVTQQCKEGKEGTHESYMELPPGIVMISETHCRKTGSEGGFQWKSSPCRSASFLPAGGEVKESPGTMGHLLKAQEQPESLPVNPDHLKTQEFENLQNEIIGVKAATEIKDTEDVRSLKGEMKMDGDGDSENAAKLEGRLLQQNKQHKDDTAEISAGYCVSDWAESDTSTRGDKLTRLGNDTGNKIECLSDHPHGAAIETAGREEQQEVRRAEGGMKMDGGDSSKKYAKSEPQQKEHKANVTETSLGDCVSNWTEGATSKCGTQSSPLINNAGNKLSFFQAEFFPVEHKGFADFTFPPSDAIVPGPHHLSRRGLSNTMSLICNDRFSPVPSAFTLPDRVPGGFDTFKKIQLSPDVDDDGPGNSPPLSSLSGQLLKTSGRQLHRSMPGGESDQHEETPENGEGGAGEEMVGSVGCHAEDTGGRFLSETGAISQSGPDSYNHVDAVSTESDRPASDVHDCPKFEMKEQFDTVLKELTLYFEISMSEFASDNRASSPEQCRDITDPVGGDPSDCKEHLSSPELGRHRDKSSGNSTATLIGIYSTVFISQIQQINHIGQTLSSRRHH